MDEKDPGRFERIAAEGVPGGLLSEFWFFLRNNRKWWLAPVLIILLLLSALVLLSSTAMAPFIYTLF